MKRTDINLDFSDIPHPRDYNLLLRRRNVSDVSTEFTLSATPSQTSNSELVPLDYEGVRFLIEKAAATLIKLSETALLLGKKPLPKIYDKTVKRAIIKRSAEDALIKIVAKANDRITYLCECCDFAEYLYKSLCDIIDQKGSMNSLAKAAKDFLVLRANWTANDLAEPFIAMQLVRFVGLSNPISAFISFVITPVIVDNAMPYVEDFVYNMAQFEEDMQKNRKIILEDMPWMAAFIGDAPGFQLFPPMVIRSHITPEHDAFKNSNNNNSLQNLAFSPSPRQTEHTQPSEPLPHYRQHLPARLIEPLVPTLTNTDQPTTNSNIQPNNGNGPKVNNQNPAPLTVKPPVVEHDNNQSTQTNTNSSSSSGSLNNSQGNVQTAQKVTLSASPVNNNSSSPSIQAVPPTSSRSQAQNHMPRNTQINQEYQGRTIEAVAIVCSDDRPQDRGQPSNPPTNNLILRPDEIGYERSFGNYTVAVGVDPIGAIKFGKQIINYIKNKPELTQDQKNGLDMDKRLYKYLTTKNNSQRDVMASQILIVAQNNAKSAPKDSSSSLYYNSLVWGLKGKQEKGGSLLSRRYGVKRNKENLTAAYINAWEKEAVDALKKGDYSKYSDIAEKYKGVPSHLQSQYKIFEDFLLHPERFGGKELGNLLQLSSLKDADLAFMRFLKDKMSTNPILKRDVQALINGLTHDQKNKYKDIFNNIPDSPIAQPSQAEASSNDTPPEPSVSQQSQSESTVNESNPDVTPDQINTDSEQTSEIEPSDEAMRDIEERRRKEFRAWAVFRLTDYATGLIDDPRTRRNTQNTIVVARNIHSISRHPYNSFGFFNSLLSLIGMVNQYTLENREVDDAVRKSSLALSCANLFLDAARWSKPSLNPRGYALPTATGLAAEAFAVLGPIVIENIIADDPKFGAQRLSTSYFQYLMSTSKRFVKKNPHTVCSAPSDIYFIYHNGSLILQAKNASDASLAANGSGLLTDPTVATYAGGATVAALVCYGGYKVMTRNSNPDYRNYKVYNNLNNAVHYKNSGNDVEAEKHLYRAYDNAMNKEQREQVFSAAYSYGLLSSVLCEKHAESFIKEHPDNVTALLLLSRYYLENNNHPAMMKHAKKLDAFAKKHLGKIHHEIKGKKEEYDELKKNIRKDTDVVFQKLSPEIHSIGNVSGCLLSRYYRQTKEFEKLLQDPIAALIIKQLDKIESSDEFAMNRFNEAKNNLPEFAGKIVKGILDDAALEIAEKISEHRDLTRDHRELLNMLSIYWQRAALSGNTSDELYNDAKYFDDTSGYIFAKYYLEHHAIQTRSKYSPFALLCLTLADNVYGSRIRPNRMVNYKNETPVSKHLPGLRQVGSASVYHIDKPKL